MTKERLDETSLLSGSSNHAARVMTAQAARHFPVIEGYRITDIVGQGGMGIVYRAVQTALHRTVALKVLPAILGTASPDSVSRFKREATAAARLHHTNIIPIYDFGESHDTYYCAMELIEGLPLNELIQHLRRLNAPTVSAAGFSNLFQRIIAGENIDRQSDSGVRPAVSKDDSGLSTSSAGGRSRIYFQQVALWMADAADALHYAHGEGIIHRDIKPSNLIMSRDGRLMVADFGLARLSDDNTMTATGALMGTLRYMSPEQAMARRVRADHRTDVYSLGATLYELLTFQPAVPGEDEKEILGRIIAREPTPPRKVLPAVPHDLETICLKALEKNPDTRYLTARALAEDLRRYIQDMPIEARRPGPLTRGRKFVKRHKAVSVAVLALVLLSALSWASLRYRAGARRQRVEMLVEEGMRLGGKHEWEHAVDSFERALAINPTHDRALGNLANLYKSWHNSLGGSDDDLLQRAVEVNQLAVEHFPNDSRFLNQRAVLLKMQRRYEEAIQTLDRAAQLDPGAFAPWTNLGMMHALNRDLEKAELCCIRSIELAEARGGKPVDPYRNLAVIEHYLGRPGAKGHIETALKHRRTDATSWMILAYIAASSPLPDTIAQSRDWAITAVQNETGQAADVKRPVDPRVYRIRALAELRNGGFDEAISNAAKAIQNGDLESVNHLLMAIAQGRLDRTDQAAQSLKDARRTWPASLASPAAIDVTARNGVVWIESHKELSALKREVEHLLADPTARIPNGERKHEQPA